MVVALSLYISASPEMDAECELVGQALAQMSRTIHWTIKRTPSPGSVGDLDWEVLQTCELYLILLGMDVMAPMGVEYEMMQRRGVRCFAYLNRSATASPAASYFGRHARAQWNAYKTAHEFARDFEQALITELIQGTPGYGLGLPEIEALSIRLREMKEDQEEKPEGEDRRGAGSGGVILPSASN